MSERLILASGSKTRSDLLRRAGLEFEAVSPRVDEDVLKEALEAEGRKPRDIADALAEAKARKIAGKEQGCLVLGSDQVLDLDGKILSKPKSPDECLFQLKALRGRRHSLFSAAVLYEDQKPVWRFVGHVRLTMRRATDAYLDDYVERNWESVRHSVGGYKLEDEGARLFHKVEGDSFTVLGLPLLEVLSYLTLRGTIPG